jgi:tetratricopeptide (TPR) repeat protein
MPLKPKIFSKVILGYSMAWFDKKVFRFLCLCSFMFYLFGVWAGAGCSRKMAERRSAPTRTWSCNDEADRAMKLHDYQTGILLHERILEKDPANALALYHLGYAYGQIGDHRKEVFHYKKAIALGFSADSIYFNLGMAYGELSEIEKSISAFKRSLGVNPETSDSHFGLAMAYYQKGTADKLAEEEFLKTIDIEPIHVDARLYLSMLYAERGEIQKACQQLRETLMIDPTNERARLLLEKIEKE